MLKKKIEMEVDLHISTNELLQEIKNLDPIENLRVLKYLALSLDEKEIADLKNFFTCETESMRFVEMAVTFMASTKALFPKEMEDEDS